MNTLISHIQHKDITTFYYITKKIASYTFYDSSRARGTRVNLVHIKVTNMYITDTEVTFTFDDALKHFQPNYKQKPPIYI